MGEPVTAQVLDWVALLAEARWGWFSVSRDARGYPVSVEWKALHVVEGRRAGAVAVDVGGGEVEVGGGDYGIACRWLLAMHQSEWRRERRNGRGAAF